MEQSRERVQEVFERYGNMIYRTAFVLMKNKYDAEDAVQDVLIRFMECRKSFQEEEHRKAWLIRVTINICKNKLRFYHNHPGISMEELSARYEEPEDLHIMEYLLALPCKYREVLLLYYVEGYPCREIARLLRASEAAVRKRLERGRKQLQRDMGGEKDE